MGGVITYLFNLQSPICKILLLVLPILELEINLTFPRTHMTSGSILLQNFSTITTHG